MKALLSFEFYRVSADPFLGGRSGRAPATESARCQCPEIDQQLMPSAIKPFADALKQASAFAVDAMGTKLDPLRAENVGEAVASVDGERTSAEQRLAALLKQQAEPAN